MSPSAVAYFSQSWSLTSSCNVFSTGSSAFETVPFEVEKAEQLLVKFIVSNYLSFRLVNSESFGDLIEYLQPKCLQKRLQVSTKKMTIDNKTRWGSAYEMMKRLLNSRPAISASLAIVTGTKKKPPSDLSVDEWGFLRQFVSVLEPLHEATPLFRRILHYHLKTSDADDMCTNELKDTIREDLRKRWGCLLNNIPDAFLLAVYLDPRLKDFSFVQYENQRRSLVEKAKNLCGQCLETSDGTALSQGELILTQSMVEEEQESEKITAQKQRLSVLFGGIVEDSNDSAESCSLDELDLYHQKKTVAFAIENKVTNPLSWWKKNQLKYPKLAKLARQFLCIIASSVPCERVFSKSGWCVNKRRTLLSDANVSPHIHQHKQKSKSTIFPTPPLNHHHLN